MSLSECPCQDPTTTGRSPGVGSQTPTGPQGPNYGGQFSEGQDRRVPWVSCGKRLRGSEAGSDRGVSRAGWWVREGLGASGVGSREVGGGPRLQALRTVHVDRVRFQSKTNLPA